MTASTPSSEPEPFPAGHGFALDDPASAVCACGLLLHECVDMLRWGFRRAEQVRQNVPEVSS